MINVTLACMNDYRCVIRSRLGRASPPLGRDPRRARRVAPSLGPGSPLLAIAQALGLEVTSHEINHRIAGARAAIFGSPDVIAIMAGRDIAEMDAVIDGIAEVRLIVATDSKVARWIDGVELPFTSTSRRLARLRRGKRA